VILFGAGTSGRLALLDAAELGPTFGVSPGRYVARLAGGDSAFERPAEGIEDDEVAGASAAADVQSGDVAVGIAASGRTPWVLGAIEEARRRGAATVGVTSSPGSPLDERVDVAIVVETGQEAIAGSSRLKAGTAQKLVLNAFSTALMVRLGKVHGNLMVDVRPTNRKLKRRATRLVEQIGRVDRCTAERVLDEVRDVKTAVVMLRYKISAEAARDRLERAGANLRRAMAEGVEE
jgi:N-acetylmuramic acid 6-phosphate etherase